MTHFYPSASAILTADVLGAASLIDLGTIPVQAGAIALVDQVTAEVDAYDGKKRRCSDRKGLQRAVGAIAGGTLRSWRKGEPVYHPRDSKAFTGELVTHRPFIAAVDGMVALDLLHTRQHSNRPYDWGEDGFSFTGLAARLWPTQRFLELASEHGVTPDTVRDTFDLEFSTIPPVLPRHLVERRPLSEPRRSDRKAVRPVQAIIPIAGDEAAQQLAEWVAEANAFAAEHDVQGCLPPRWKRIYGPSWLLGGRWYALGASGRYQALPKTRRAAITIDGQPTAEIDIQASHLSILLGLLGLGLPDGDPYEFSALPRSVVKKWITATIGKGTPVVRWAQRALNDQPELAGFSPHTVGAAVMERFPFMAAPAESVAGPARLAELSDIGRPSRLLAGRIMGIEADALSVAMDYLRCRGVLALPIHDSLVVPADRIAVTEDTLKRAFHGRARAKVRTKIEGRKE